MRLPKLNVRLSRANNGKWKACVIQIDARGDALEGADLLKGTGITDENQAKAAVQYKIGRMGQITGIEYEVFDAKNQT